mmetsp:Transcript_5613/g.9412  ORF Transcript_5613/g.9412 Transcript_5613/m.9412 type:complete len:168 (+) Transcript_5613:140-643(+)
MGVCASCCCMQCIMDSYLHLYVREISKANFKGDINIAGTVDVALRIKYEGWIQDSKILKDEKGTISFNEPIILENAKPNPEAKLIIEVWDVDTTTADDILAIGEMDVPQNYGENQGETRVELKSPSGGEIVGEILIDQLHFIKQKVRRYMGPCKCCCCCLDTGVVAE